MQERFQPGGWRAALGGGNANGDMSLVQVDKPDQFPLVAADQQKAPTELNVTGAVFPDISREVPVISLANGRVIDLKTRLDDNVKKGQLLVQRAKPRHQQCVRRLPQGRKRRADEQQGLPSRQDLYEHGAISQGHAGTSRRCRAGCARPT
jgi:cobalt-zinc-cadmium efflux system membrane fusion protein